eukprot:scpid62035/ scgid3146/ Putative 1-aminocyclopropane-1-carboxylate deaminase
MTHSTLSGNKVRKLEFLLADAIQQGCTSVITCGSIQTNHGRATAVAARELGLDPYLVVRSRPADVCVCTLLFSLLRNKRTTIRALEMFYSTGWLVLASYLRRMGVKKRA